MLSPKCLTSWKAAYGIQISVNELKNVDIPNICEEVEGRLADGGSWRGASAGLSLGSAGSLLHGAALLLRQKANQTLQDAFELTQKLVINDYQNIPKYSDSEDEMEESDSSSEEDEVSEEQTSATSVSTSNKRSADVTNDLEMSKRLRSIVVSSDDSSCDMADVSHSDVSGSDNDSKNDDRNCQIIESSKEEEGPPTVEDRGVQRCRCVLCARGLDPRLKLGVMLVYENHAQHVPTKIVMASINPAANLL